ncbi:hypothetical protein [Aneurinibacillus migulanus]|uniref:hypothetical protein n=1 Tax=Aneurinibacillus migulanus TaxID=47500 RepID=UPI000A6DF1B7|nr:hypothetical protein [Aneurinibacillus migulanus]MCP1355765.1 hypothetical protein [Aneurinibacillus migulanus]MED0891664.1 hypothetical protein [Aneurinibacillus migulanus]MED1617596.1 hypothetical protein [Aneurinibacillus migulanus]MED4726592.1 hypothetical protein [Aneurinibacillus migulanus]GED13004.1 hypothetical protein AMI01nite_09950 [Aneurinibacillus migulanus]
MAIFYIVILSLLSLLLLFGASYLVAVVLNRFHSSADWNESRELVSAREERESEGKNRP